MRCEESDGPEVVQAGVMPGDPSVDRWAARLPKGVGARRRGPTENRVVTRRQRAETMRTSDGPKDREDGAGGASPGGNSAKGSDRQQRQIEWGSFSNR